MLWPSILLTSLLLGCALCLLSSLSISRYPKTGVWLFASIALVTLIQCEWFLLSIGLKSATGFFLTTPLYFFLPVSLFFHLRNLLDNHTYRKTDLIHVLPGLLFLVNLTPVFFSNNTAPIMRLNGYMLMGTHALQAFLYAVLCYRLNVPSQLNTVVFTQRFVYLTAGFLFSFSALSIGILIFFILNSQNRITFEYFLSVFMAIQIYVWILLYIKIPREGLLHVETHSKYTHSTLSAVNAKKIVREICMWLEKEHAYLNSELKLAAAANANNTSTHYLSQAINQELNMSFLELINQHRVEYAKKLLSNDSINILEIAYDSGFNSKSTFNRAFKKITGLTPSQFSASQQQPG